MSSVFTIGTQVNLLVTDFLRDREAIRYATCNKHFYEHLLKYYKCKLYYWNDTIPQGQCNVRKLLVREYVGFSAFRNTITHLEFSFSFNLLVNDLDRFTKVTELNFGAYFNQQLDYLPPNLIRLTFGYCFNRPLHNLPTLPHLESICFGEHFDQPIENIPLFKGKITHIRFGTLSTFNQPVNNHLPTTLQSLVFGSHFNQNVNHLPPTLSILGFGESFNQPIHQLPNTLQYIEFGREFNQNIDSLSSLTNLTHLCFGNEFNQPTNYLPQNLTYLQYGTCFNQPVDSLSSLSSLDYLVFGSNFNHPINGILPKSLTTVQFGEHFKQSVENLPPQCEIIID